MILMNLSEVAAPFGTIASTVKVNFEKLNFSEYSMIFGSSPLLKT